MLVLKLMLVPLFVALIAIVGRKWGAKLAGLLSGFPVIAGPIIYFLYIDHGLELALAAASAAVAGVVPLSSFCFTYAWMAKRYSWVACELVSLLVYALLCIFVVRLGFDVYTNFALALIVVIAQILLSPRHSQIVGNTPASNIEISVRMLAAACLVVVVTYFAEALGTGYSGVLAAFPLASSVIAVFSHKNHSAFHAMDSLKSLKFGLLSMPVFFFSLAFLANYISFHVAFVFSIITALAIQAGIWSSRAYFARVGSS